MKINETKRTGRVTRASINGVRNVLTVSGKDPDYVYRVVNDDGDRVAQMQERGYEIVTDNNVTVGERRVANPTQEGSPVMASVGGGKKAYVMRIRKDWHGEDQAAKAAQVAQTEGAMQSSAKEGMYGKLELSS
jgi:hypothetical protein